ncbi:MAG: response regulator [Treponema sp.]|jgi:signal transduction histidine kinase/CheY-like chemotaxis protein|nr:response regulator [Treponema sp.]
MSDTDKKTALFGLSLGYVAIIVYDVIRLLEIKFFLYNYRFFHMVLLFSGLEIVLITVCTLCLLKKNTEKLAFWCPLILFIGFCVGSLFTENYDKYVIVHVAIIVISSSYKNLKQFIKFYTISTVIAILMLFLVIRSSEVKFHLILIQWVPGLLLSFYLIFLENGINARKITVDDSMQSFYSFLYSTQNYTAIIDNNGKIKYISKSMMANFSKLNDATYTYHRPIIDLFPSMDMKLCFLEIILSPESSMTKIISFKLNQKTHYVKITSNRLLDDRSKTYASISVDMSDITEIYESELAAEHASEAKSQFLAKMSHEIRTPMNAIIGMSDIVLRDDLRDNLPQDIIDNVMNIHQSGKNLLSIINDILDFSKIESGKMEITTIEYETSSLFIDVLSIIRANLMDKNIDFVCYIDPGLPSRLRGDEVRVRQIATNLLSNAVKYTREGHISFTVTGVVEEQTKLRIRLSVEDTGLGIKTEDQAKLFEEFQQFDIEQNRGVTGTGLGLVITRRLAQAMGGDIAVNSIYGQGSTFTAEIIQEIVEWKPVARLERTVQVVVYEPSRLKLESALRTFERLGADVYAASNREEFELGLSDKTLFVFLVEDFFTEAQKILKERGLSILVVIMTDYGNIVSQAHLQTLVLPLHAITIANILNGETANIAYGSGKVKFIAPSVHILIVDDMSVNLKVAKGLLKPYQMHVDTAISGKEAIKLVKQNDYDIVFMDHMMPDMDGIQCTRIIRSLGENGDDKYQNMTIVALTANAISGMREKFIADGLTDFLSKPIDLKKLEDILDRYVPQSKREVVRARLVLSGVNTAKGIAQNGSWENYREILRLYMDDVRKRLAMFALPANSAEDMVAVSAGAHALKNSCASIGATRLADLAQALEYAGKKGNAVEVNELMSEFYERLKRLLKEIDDLPEMQDMDGVSHAPLDTSLVERAITALELEDMMSIDESLAALRRENYDAAVKKVLNRAADDVLIMDYEAALTELKSLLNKEIKSEVKE